MILRGVFFCILKSTSHSTNVYVMDNCLTVLLQDFAIHLMPKRSWLAVQIACHPFYTPLSAQHRYQSLVDRHQTVLQGTWILPVAQPPADTDPEQVFHPYFVLFIHAGSSWSLPEKKKKKTTLKDCKGENRERCKCQRLQHWYCCPRYTMNISGNPHLFMFCSRLIPALADVLAAESLCWT